MNDHFKREMEKHDAELRKIKDKSKTYNSFDHVEKQVFDLMYESSDRYGHDYGDMEEVAFPFMRKHGKTSKDLRIFNSIVKSFQDKKLIVVHEHRGNSDLFNFTTSLKIELQINYI